MKRFEHRGKEFFIVAEEGTIVPGGKKTMVRLEVVCDTFVSGRTLANKLIDTCMGINREARYLEWKHKQEEADRKEYAITSHTEKDWKNVDSAKERT